MSAVLDKVKAVRAAKRMTATGKTPTIGADIDALWALREQRRTLDAESKKIAGEESEIEDRLMETMGAQGVDKSTGTKASASISSATVANVVDWDAFYAYIHKNRYWHLLQQRVSDPAWREVSKDGTKPAPGTQAFVKRRLNLRTVST